VQTAGGSPLRDNCDVAAASAFLETTAGLRQPLLVARTQVVAEKRLRFTTPGQAAATTAAAGAYRRRYAVAICNGVLFPLVPTTTTVCRKNDDFCDARTQVHKSDRRQPAVGVRETHLQERLSKVAEDRRRCAHQRRCSRSSEPTGGSRPPALVGVRTFVGGKTIFAMHERRFTRATGVSPPWVLGKRTCRSA
jgi:hypothetical protein